MYKRIIAFLQFVIALLISFNICAQERTVYGITTTFDSIPLIGATVKVKSSGQTVLTDSLGKFSVTCKPTDKLNVSANGFYGEKVKLTSKTKLAAINLKLKPGVENIEHAVGYGHVSDKEKLIAVSSLNKNDVDFSQYSNMTELIRGRISGVQVINGELVIRGRGTITPGASGALILIDGVPSSYTTLKMIPPVSVKNISVLKDASAAIYGIRAANGVVIIETKR